MTNIGTTTNYVRNCSSWARTGVRGRRRWREAGSLCSHHLMKSRSSCDPRRTSEPGPPEPGITKEALSHETVEWSSNPGRRRPASTHGRGSAPVTAGEWRQIGYHHDPEPLMEQYYGAPDTEPSLNGCRPYDKGAPVSRRDAVRGTVRIPGRADRAHRFAADPRSCWRRHSCAGARKYTYRSRRGGRAGGGHAARRSSHRHHYASAVTQWSTRSGTDFHNRGRFSEDSWR